MNRTPLNDQKPDDIEILNSSERSFMVMLIDDDAMIAEAIHQMLDSENDIQFHYCSDPGAAVEIAESVSPTVILLDIVMPNIDGLTVLRYLRANEETKDIPIIALSMKEEAELKAKVFAAGGNDYLVKLPQQVEMLARIRYHSQSYIRLLQRDEAYHALRISQNKLAESNIQLHRLATIDGLTGIPNRRQFDETVAVEWRRAIRRNEWLSLILLDIDYFKKCNDVYGHQVGDEVLKTVAKAVESCLHRPADLVARYGGEEFVILLPETDAAGAGIMAETVREKVQSLQLKNSGSTIADFITVSAGVATILPDAGKECAVLVQLADKALYTAKDAGRNRVFTAPVKRG